MTGCLPVSGQSGPIFFNRTGTSPRTRFCLHFLSAAWGSAGCLSIFWSSYSVINNVDANMFSFNF